MSAERLGEETMNIAVIGGTGLIGSKVVSRLRRLGHRVAVLSRGHGVDVLTGVGLAEALEGIEIVINTIDALFPNPSEMSGFFVTAERNISQVNRTAGVKHYLALSVLGADRLALNAYYLAKLMQEDAIRTSGQPYTIVRSAPFFESLYAIIGQGNGRDRVDLPPVPMQAIAAADVAEAIASVALGAPMGRVVEVVGPETMQLPDLALRIMTADEDPRDIRSDGNAEFLGMVLGNEELTCEAPWRIGATRFDDWLRTAIAHA